MTAFLNWPDLGHGVSATCDGMTVTLTRRNSHKERVWVAVSEQTFLAMADQIRANETDCKDGNASVSNDPENR